MRKQNGFTLIELLVVVAIIAVLIAMLLPALGSARREARKVVCQSNMRQVGVAFEAYKGDSSGFYPAARFRWEYRWWHHLIPYLGLGSYSPNNPQDTARWTQNDITKIPSAIICPDSPKSAPLVQQMNSWVMGGGAMGFSRRNWTGPYPVTTFEYKRYYWPQSLVAGERESSYWIMLYEGDWVVDSGTFHFWRTAHPRGSNILTAAGSVEFWRVDIPKGESDMHYGNFNQAWGYWSSRHPDYFLRFFGPGYYNFK